VAPLRKYNEEWLKKAIIKIIEPKTQEIVTKVMPPQPQHVPIKDPVGRK